MFAAEAAASTPWPVIATVVTAVGGVLAALVTALVQVRRARAEVAHLEAQTRGLDDAAWERMIATQTEHLVAPLRTEVERQGKEIVELRDALERIRTGYWRAIHYIRELQAWGRRRDKTPMPAPPPALADDI